MRMMIHKVSVRASEFQSHSKQVEETITSPEEDSASIVQDVVADINDEASASVSENEADWGQW